MNRVTYSIRLPFDTLRVSANLADAAAPIRIVSADGQDDDDSGPESSTPFQTADCSHDPRRMAHMVLDYMGPDYWSDPSQESKDEDGETRYAGLSRHDYIDSIILSIS